MNSHLLTDEESQTIKYYDQYASEWAERRKKITEPSFWHHELNDLKQIKTFKGKILDIGSGAGREAIELINMGYEYVGIDVSKELLKIAQTTNPACQFHFTTVYDLPFEAQTFDAFFSWAMLPHIPKHRISEALCSLRRVLKQDAIGFIAMREGEGYNLEQETGRWFSYYTQDEFEKILIGHGFTIETKNRKQSRINLVWLTYFVRMTGEGTAPNLL